MSADTASRLLLCHQTLLEDCLQWL
jgi:hypothetical protein